jgi:hypothetical protein
LLVDYDQNTKLLTEQKKRTDHAKQQKRQNKPKEEASETLKKPNQTD